MGESGKRYEVVLSRSGRKSLVWYHDRMKEWGPVTLEEIQEASVSEFPGVDQSTLQVRIHECGLVLKPA